MVPASKWILQVLKATPSPASPKVALTPVTLTHTLCTTTYNKLNYWCFPSSPVPVSDGPKFQPRHESKIQEPAMLSSFVAQESPPPSRPSRIINGTCPYPRSGTSIHQDPCPCSCYPPWLRYTDIRAYLSNYCRARALCWRHSNTLCRLHVERPISRPLVHVVD